MAAGDRTTTFTLDDGSSVPPYEQVRAQIAAQVAEGTLPPGTRLPTVRRLASDLGLAVNTVAKSYRELEAAGLVETRGRGGTVVTAGSDRLRQRLLSAAEHYAAIARDIGVSADEALRIAAVAMVETPVVARGSQRFDESEPGVEKFSLTALAREQLEIAKGASSGRSSSTVYGGHEHVLRQTVIALAAGKRLEEHESPGEATVHVLRGRVRLDAGGNSWNGSPGDLLVVPSARHSLEAVDDAIVLLTVAKT